MKFFDFSHVPKKKIIGFLYMFFKKSKKKFASCKNFLLEKIIILVEKVILYFATGEKFHNLFVHLLKKSKKI